MYKFEWDEKKAEVNLVKHGINFKEAIQVFDDLYYIEIYDEKIINEDRFICIGLSHRFNLLTVVFCEREQNTIRIISARKAVGKERDLYEKRIRCK